MIRIVNNKSGHALPRRSVRTWIHSLLLAVGAVFLGAAIRAEGAALAEYVARPDPSFGWVKRSEGTDGEVAWVELIMTSQTWQGHAWKHQLWIIKPQRLDRDNQHALLFIDGGRWKDRYDRPPEDNAPPKRGEFYLGIANRLEAPVALLKHVPHQPLFDGKTEDTLIAYTFEQFLERNGPDWPLLMPMVKAAVRAMDVVQTYVETEWSIPVETFTVTGASKRGWTTWLTAAVDPRVTAFAPMVIDVLDMGTHIEHQEAVWGAYSEQIADYTERGLHEQFETEAGRELLGIVDPYQYRKVLNQPKLLLISTNDRYWPLDALNLYWSDLVGAKYILYLPNNGHKIRDYRRVIAGINALHRHATGEQLLPTLDWQFEETPGHLSLEIRSDRRPRVVQVWTASAPSRDFRESYWHARQIGRSHRGGYRYELELPKTGYAAIYGEALYDSGPKRFWLSTNVRIVDANGTAPVVTTTRPE